MLVCITDNLDVVTDVDAGTVGAAIAVVVLGGIISSRVASKLGTPLSSN